jgi:hypothetical protein
MARNLPRVGESRLPAPQNGTIPKRSHGIRNHGGCRNSPRTKITYRTTCKITFEITYGIASEITYGIASEITSEITFEIAAENGSGIAAERPGYSQAHNPVTGHSTAR